MKKTSICLILTINLIAVLSAPSYAEDEVEKNDERSVYFSIGFSAYYSWWRSTIQQETFPGYTQDYTVTKSDFIYGPSLSLQGTNGWGLSANFLYGFFDKEVKKFDGDLIVSNRITEWLKIYFGGKYLGLIGGSSYLHNGGLGTGLSFTIELYKGLYLLPNISGLCLGGVDDFGTISVTAGANGVAALAYYIEKIKTTISAGFRYQYLKQVYTTADGLNDDQFYGIFLTVVVTF